MSIRYLRLGGLGTGDSRRNMFVEVSYSGREETSYKLLVASGKVLNGAGLVPTQWVISETLRSATSMSVVMAQGQGQVGDE